MISNENSTFGVKNSSGALALAFRELAQQVLVGTTQEVGLDVTEAEPVARIRERLVK